SMSWFSGSVKKGIFGSLFGGSFFIFALGLMSLFRRKESETKEKNRSRELKAILNVMRDLDKEASDAQKGFALIEETLHRYLQWKFEVETGSMTRPQLMALLKAKGIADETTQRIDDLLNRCDLIRFSPSSTGFGDSNKVFQLA